MRIRDDPKVALNKCRPDKIKAYLCSEAVRVSKQNPPGIDRDSAAKMWSRLCSNQDFASLECVHARPLCQSLGSLKP